MSAETVDRSSWLLPLPYSPVDQSAVAWLRRQREEAGPRPTADGTLGRGSRAHACARRVSLDMAGVEPTTLDVDHWSLIAFQVGQDWHDRIQHVLARDFGARLEVPVSYRPKYDYSGNVDAVVDANPVTGEPGTVAVEIKSMKEWAFEWATGRKRGQVRPAGPKAEHVTQVASYALAPQLQARWLWIIYTNKNDGAIAEWIIDVDEPLPHLDGVTARKLAEVEVERQHKLAEGVRAGRIAKPIVPGVGRVDPADPDRPWNCDYCPHEPLCRRLGSGSTTVDRVEAARAELTGAGSHEQPEENQ